MQLFLAVIRLASSLSGDPGEVRLANNTWAASPPAVAETEALTGYAPEHRAVSHQDSGFATRRWSGGSITDA